MLLLVVPALKIIFLGRGNGPTPDAENNEDPY
jgi:hypothetical protein